MTAKTSTNHLDLLRAARRVADFASTEGVPSTYERRRTTYQHAGAVVADAVLQAGLNYKSVVRPRVERIIRDFPDADTIGALICVVKKGTTAALLGWTDSVKAERFERVVIFLHDARVDTTNDLRKSLDSSDFCEGLQSINGIGPKTVDYMACLVGLESIAVDRHIRSFAARAGIDKDDYSFLKSAFCFAADLLSIPRREFDAWIWSKESERGSSQLSLTL